MDTNFFDETSIDKAADLIRKGELVAFPTETVYGLGADATNEQAVRKVYQAKGRPSDNPLIVHIRETKDILPFVENFPKMAWKLAEIFWPGPLTIILPLKKDALPEVVTGGLSTAAFRIPNNSLTLALIEHSGVPLVGPSANTSGKPSPTTAQHVLHDLNGKIAGIIDGGTTEVGLESTVIDLTEEIPVILRPGAITLEDLEKVVGEVAVDQELLLQGGSPKAPGMKYKHYAPSTPVKMIDWQKNNWSEAIAWANENDLTVALLCSSKVALKYGEKVAVVFPLSQKDDVIKASQNLFAGLRYTDDLKIPVDIIFIQTYPEIGHGVAYMNRLKKSANHEQF